MPARTAAAPVSGRTTRQSGVGRHRTGRPGHGNPVARSRGSGRDAVVAQRASDGRAHPRRGCDDGCRRPLAAPGTRRRCSSRLRQRPRQRRCTDTDHDGLYDTFESYQSHTSPRSADTDHDGVRDGSEDPDRRRPDEPVPSSLPHTSPRKADTDGDGLRDGSEDPDHDGLTNRREQSAGTHPRRADYRRRWRPRRPRGSRPRRPLEHHGLPGGSLTRARPTPTATASATPWRTAMAMAWPTVPNSAAA